MVSDPYERHDPSSNRKPSRSDDFSNPFINALIGGIAGVVLSFIPFSTVVGGAVAGYLQGGTAEDGVRVGALAGIVMLVPFVFFALFGMMFLGFGMMGQAMPFAFGGVFFIGALLLGVLYTVGLGILGGYLGVYLKHEL